MAFAFKTAIIVVIVFQNYMSQFDVCAGRDQEKEHCGRRRFYCKANGSCVDRSKRCPSRSHGWKRSMLMCPNQPHCHHVNGDNALSPLFQRPPHMTGHVMQDRFYVLTALSPIYRTGSKSGSRKKRNIFKNLWRTLARDPWRHSFIHYRGFVYEFGTYGVHELDVNDPDYKYNREWTSDWKRVGTSMCGRKKLRQFLDEWDKLRGSYSWHSNNCHTFTRTLLAYLEKDCRNSTGITRL